MQQIPELLAPAGTLDSVRAAVANGANAVYLGASMYNARDEDAQLSLDELAQACAMAHAHGVRVYLAFNVLLKSRELIPALEYLGDCIDRGIDAAIVQDLGVVRLIKQVYPDLEIHGSTQITVHDAAGARVMKRLGLSRVVLARENTLDDIRAIREDVPDLELETFVHGALCISYSGQCFMSGMISERSANRGSCAQSCRKHYVLRDDLTGESLDRGYLISAKDLAAHDYLADLCMLGIGCLKVEGRKKKPEYVATVIGSYRAWLDAIASGEWRGPPAVGVVEPLVQIFSRGNTGGMYGGRQGRDYVTRTQPDNRGLQLGKVVGRKGRDLVVEVSHPLSIGDGVGLVPVGEQAGMSAGATIGGIVQRSKTAMTRDGMNRQVIGIRSQHPLARVAEGWLVVRTSDVTLLGTAQASYSNVPIPSGLSLTRVDVVCFGCSGGPLKTLWRAADVEVTASGEMLLVPAGKRALSMKRLREQFGRLGETALRLGALDISGLGEELFLPVSELNRIRQEAAEKLREQLELTRLCNVAERTARISECVSRMPDTTRRESAHDQIPALRVIVYDSAMAREAARGGATEIILDPFLRHPMPARSRVLALRDELAGQGITLRLRTPTIVRPAERRALEPWLSSGMALQSGHVGLVHELGRERDVIADYAANVFNEHTAAQLFGLGASRIVASIELTVAEIREMTAPWSGAGFDVLVYGRPEGMTVEHCVLSAAFDRVPTTCRDLCVKRHPRISLTDPTGYTFGVATDSACRNRLLHSRPIEASEFLHALWQNGIRGYQMVFNVAGDPVESLVRSWRNAIDAVAAGAEAVDLSSRSLLGGVFTRGHFVRAV